MCREDEEAEKEEGEENYKISREGGLPDERY